MIFSVAFWCLWVGTAAFLAVAAARNHRSGYRREQSRVSLLAEGVAWLGELKQSTEQEAHPQRSESQTASPAIAAASTTPVEQLLRLGVALEQNKGASIEAGSLIQEEVRADSSVPVSKGV